MPHFTFRAAAALFAFFVGLASVWFLGLLAPAENWVAEWLVPTSDIEVPACPLDGREEADYAVYRTVLREMFDGNSKDVLLVIRRETSGCSVCGDGDVTALNWAAAETLNDFKVKNSVPGRLPPMDSAALVYKLVDSDELENLFSSRDVDGWKVFHERFPKSTGYITLSAVGFNRDYDEAFLYVARNCGWLCGNGGYVLLRKTVRGWEIERQRIIWVS